MSATYQWASESAARLSAPGVAECLLLAVGVGVLTWFLQYRWQRRRLYELSAQMHGPRTLPVLGSALMFAGSTENILSTILYIFRRWSSPARVWLGHKLFITISKPRDLEILLTSPQSLAKDELYRYAIPFVGSGLFTAPLPKWKRHRKVIMPTFNPKILDSFVEVFQEQSVILVERLRKEIGRTGMFNVFEYVSPCTLDIICETAMGTSVRAQDGDSEYVRCGSRALEIMYIRMFQLWYHSDFIFNLTPLAREERRCLTYLHNFTDTVVKRKRAEYQRKQTTQKLPERHENDDDDDDGVRLFKRKAFLDLLLETSDFTDREIREEVDTMMIAGNDTTATVISFLCVTLGIHRDVQTRVYEEIVDVFGDLTDGPITTADLGRLKYTEMVIKETMRMFPVGPVIVRAVTDELKLDTCVLPKGCSCVLGIMDTHYNPELWPEPNRFDPERFRPEEVAKRHPYSWLPFSAGPRNCVGPKYAMLVMKTILVVMLRTYELFADYKIADIKLKADLLLKPVHGYPIRLRLRHVPE